MLEPSDLTPERLARLAKQHVESLRAGGVEWLTRGNQQPSLFAELAAPQQPVTPGAAPPAVGGLSVEERRQALQVLAAEVSTCTRCPPLAAARSQTVFGVGAPGVDLCFVGEAPGADEDAQGEPF